MRLKVDNYCLVLILDGNSEKGGQVKSLIFDMIKAFDSIENYQNRIYFLPKRSIFFDACATCSELPSNESTKKGKDLKHLYGND